MKRLKNMILKIFKWDLDNDKKFRVCLRLFLHDLITHPIMAIVSLFSKEESTVFHDWNFGCRMTEEEKN